MTQEYFDKHWKGSSVRCAHDKSIFGKAVELVSGDYIVVETASGKTFIFPPELLEWA